MEQILVAAALLGLCCLLLRAEGLFPPGGGGRTGLLLALLIAFAVRMLLLDRCSCAHEDAALSAIAFFRGAGGFWGIRSCREAFSVPVQYVLALCAFVRTGSLQIYKYFCFFADVVLAWGCQRCVSALTVRDAPRRGVFLLALLLPSLLLHGCAGMDGGLRWVFPVLAAAAALHGEFRLCAAMLGLSAAFAPQVVWLIPVFWVFPALRQNTARALPWLLVSYFVILLPALLLGRPTSLTFPLWPPLSLRGTPGLNTLPFLSLSAPPGVGIYAVLAALTVFRLSGRDAVYDRRRQLGGVCLSVMGMSALLPGGAWALWGGEALVLALCFLDPAAIPAGLCALFASALPTVTELFPALVPLPLWWAAAAQLAGMVLLLGYVLFKKR